MKVLFLTSSLGGYVEHTQGEEIVREIVKCNNSNHFIDRLKSYANKLPTIVFIASIPQGYELTDRYANIIAGALNLDDFGIENVFTIDNRFRGDIRQTPLSANCVFLMGGNVPTQNKYFEEIGLKGILKDFGGIIIGQSAGSMNCSSIVYTQPETDEEFEDKLYQRQIKGLGLVDFAVIPHINSANEIYMQGRQSVMQMCLQDSFAIPHYGIVDYGFIEVSADSVVAYGQTFAIKNGECVQICDNGCCCDLGESGNRYLA